jgi:2-oxoglutarate dehydrogenase E2 component (dihydrolipoamide succinyltransferase)
MAIVEVKVPQLSESVAEATMLQWKKKAGDSVAVDEILIEIETDKVVLEVPAPSAGVLSELLVGDGATVVAEQLIARIDTEGKGAAAAQAAPAVQAAPAAAAPAPATPSPAAPGSKAGVAMPAAAKLLADNQLSAAAVAGTGRDGRVTKGDVLAAVAGGAAATPAVVIPTGVPTKALPQVAAPSAPDLSGRPEQRVPMSRLRARVAERLLQSQSTNAILTTFNEVNMAPVMELRKRHGEEFLKKYGVKLGFMSFFVKAAVQAMKEVPAINAQLDGDDIIENHFFDIGVAVGTDKGLMVPVVRDCDQLNFAGIEKAIGDFGKRARDGKIQLPELQGGVFTISNGGIYGSMLSTPILNHPQAAIMGLHNIVERPVVENGQIVIRPIMYLALSYDHRIIDGKEAVTFLVKVRQFIEDPQRLLFGV